MPAKKKTTSDQFVSKDELHSILSDMVESMAAAIEEKADMINPSELDDGDLDCVKVQTMKDIAEALREKFLP